VHLFVEFDSNRNRIRALSFVLIELISNCLHFGYHQDFLEIVYGL